MLEWIINLILIRSKSPCCGVYMKDSFLDMEHDMIVHECPDCGREWV